MIRMPLYNKVDREFDAFLREVKKIDNNYVCNLLGGRGLPLLIEFFSTLRNEDNKYS